MTLTKEEYEMCLAFLTDLIEKMHFYVKPEEIFTEYVSGKPRYIEYFAISKNEWYTQRYVWELLEEHGYIRSITLTPYWVDIPFLPKFREDFGILFL